MPAVRRTARAEDDLVDIWAYIWPRVCARVTSQDLTPCSEVGSLANIIVVDAANAKGHNISCGAFAKVGVPIALSILLIAWAWLRYLM